MALNEQAACESQQNQLVAGALVLMVLAVVRNFVMVFSQFYWDVDPRSTLNASVLTGIGPVGSAWLDVISVLAAAGVMFLHYRAGGRFGWKSSILAVVGGAFCLWQLPQYGPGMLTAGSWTAAMALAVAAYHMAQHKRARLVMTAVLAACVVPWLFRSIVHVYWEHAQTMEMFLKDEAKSVASRGWQMGSAQHLLFKRRLEFPDVTGAIGLSNIYGSVVAATGLLCAGLTAAMLRTRIMARRASSTTSGMVPVDWKHIALPLVLTLMAMVILYFTNSKGAVVAMLMGLGLLGLVVLAWRYKAMSHLIAPAAMVCLLLAIGLVLARGSMGPPDSDQGERSLLFRYHYWQASVRMVMHEPWSKKLLGVGPGQYKDSYIQYKNPLNPEELTSSHNVVVDFVTMLGVGGVAWSVLLIGWLWAAGRATGRWCALRDEAACDDYQAIVPDETALDAQDAEAARQRDRDVKFALAAGASLFVFEFYTRFATLLVPEQFLSWAIGAVAFIGVVALLGNKRWTKPGAAQMALFLGAAVLLIHNQIEMSFFNMQAAPLAFVIVAAAAGAGVKNETDANASSGSSGHQKKSADEGWKSTKDQDKNGLVLTGSLAMMLVFVVTAGVMMVTYVLPQTRQQTALREAAELLKAQQHMPSIVKLDEAIAAIPRDPRPYDSKVMLLVEAATYFANQNQQVPARQLMSQATVTLDDAFAAGLNDVSLTRRRAQLLERYGVLFNEPGRMTTAINVWFDVMKRSPYSLVDALHLADLLWEAGRQPEADTWYERTLELDRDNYLDPAKQLLPEQKAHVLARLAEAKS